jgi:hypothetical protein
MAMRYEVSWVEPLDLSRHLNVKAKGGWTLRHIEADNHAFLVVMEQPEDVIELRGAAGRVRERAAERTAGWPGAR